MENTLTDNLQVYAAMTEKYLEEYFTEMESIPKNLIDSILYSLKAGGKRLRPALLLGTYEIFSKEKPVKALPYAASIEMIHTYSLIHDDLPPMDDDDMRRGKPSNHMVFGEAGAILAGDALLNSAMENMLNSIKVENGFETIQAAAVIMEAAGPLGMIGGQVLDIEGAEDVDALDRMHTMKTGALIKSAVLAGGILAGCEPDEYTALEDFAQNLGFAFQIKDDILDVEGETAKLGKPVGSDNKNDKKTYVTFFGLGRAKTMLSKKIASSVSALGKINRDTGFLEKLALYIADRKV